MSEDNMENRVRALERLAEKFMDAIDGIDESLKKLVELEAHHAATRDGLGRAFNEIEKIHQGPIKDHEFRIRRIEAKMPILTLTSGWIKMGVLGVVAVVLITAFKLLFT